MIEQLQQLQTQLIADLRQIVNYAEENDLTNEQEFITFLDILNEFSIRY